MQFTDTAAGVPFVAVPPVHMRPDAPVVIAWHLLDPPGTEAGLAAALPLADLDAWRIYLGLPLCGSRSPGAEEMMRRSYADAVVNAFGPITSRAVAEFPAVYDALRARFGLTGPLAVLGGSIGSAVAQLVVLDRTDVAAAVLVSPMAQLRPIVAGNERQFGVTYTWHPDADRIADELDFVARAEQTATRGTPIRIIVGEEDDVEAVYEPAAALKHALAERCAEPAHVDLVEVEGLEHALAAEDGTPLPEAAEVDRLAVAWLRQHLR